MRKVSIVGIVILLLAAALIGYRRYADQREELIRDRASENAPTPDWAPTEAELANGNQGVGWVFGRMIGVADAPGSPNHSPFGGNSPGHPVNGMAR